MRLLPGILRLLTEGQVFLMSIIDLTGVEHHPAVEEVVDALCAKVKNKDRVFFRAEVVYFFSKMASAMRAVVVTKDRGIISVNLFALLLASSGYGKGHSVSIMEEDIEQAFKRRFMDLTMPELAEDNRRQVANYKAAAAGTDPDIELEKLNGEYQRAGAYTYTFDSGTVPAVKQMRHKMILAGLGAINYQRDEIGSNLQEDKDLLTLFLELYDQGLVKAKLTKSTNESIRNEDMDGKTPTNMLIFGTPAKLFDGSATEDLFYSLLETGYARRCIFAMGQQESSIDKSKTAEEVYRERINPTFSNTLQKWSQIAHSLADPHMYNWRMQVEDEVGIKLTEYTMACEEAASKLKAHQEIQKAEIMHRHSKALKIAGALAFVDRSSEIEMDHLMSAIKLVEESGESFQKILHREKAYVRLGKYIAEMGPLELSHHDLMEALPFYPKPNNQRNEMLNLAMSWGYSNHVIIKKRFQGTVELYQGEALKETNIDEVQVSFSEVYTEGYGIEKGPFDNLSQLATAAQDDGSCYHWCNHAFASGYRSENHARPGFDLIVLDIDGGVRIEQVCEILSDYKFMIYTTKRHSEEEHRFRLVLPSSYFLKMEADTYREFMDGIMDWLPFETDRGANQRSRKWETNPNGQVIFNDGKLFNPLPFIPRTRMNEEHKKSMEVTNMDSLERYFALAIANGQNTRNNTMIKYALVLVDSGMLFHEVAQQLHAFNEKLSDPLPDGEIDNTILKTVTKRLEEREAVDEAA